MDKTIMQQYLELLSDVKQNGTFVNDRTGVGTKSVFGRQVRYNLQEGFPAVTTKSLAFNSVVHELLWFLQGSQNIEYLVKNKVSIWNEWPFVAYLEKNSIPQPPFNSLAWKEMLTEFAEKIKNDSSFAKQWGNLGPVYGVQWRSWKFEDGVIDQLQEIIEEIKNNPHSRRLIVTAWNPGANKKILKQGGLPPCHCFFQFYVTSEKRLNLMLYQRSADLFLGVPFNIASYSLLLSMVAQVTNLKVGEFVHSIGDAHIYTNHFQQVDLQLARTPKKLPKLWLNPKIKNINDFTFDDIKLVDYEHDPPIIAPVAV